MLLVKLFVGFYGLAKEAFNFEIIQNHTAKNAHLKATIKVLTIILTLLLLSTYIIVVPFIILRCFLYVILKWKHGKSFGSFLSGVAALLEVQNEKSTIITVLTVEEDNFDDFYEKLKIIVKKIHECNYMFGSIVKNFFGYKYYLKDQVKSEEVLRKLTLTSNPTISRGDILKFLEDYKVFGDGKLWEVIVFEQPITDDSNKDGAIKKLSFMIRINHCITDAYFMIALFKKYVLDPEVTETKEFIMEKSTKKPFSLDDVYLNTNPLNPKLDEFLFHGSENEMVATYLEDKIEYVQKIKKIKNSLGVAFNDVLLAGLVKSVSDFMHKKLGKCSKDVGIFMTTRGRSDDILNILNGKFDTNELSNEFAILQFVAQMPKKDMTNIDSLKSMNGSCTRAKLSIDVLLAYLIPKLTFPFFPMFIVKFSWYLLTRHICLMSTNMSAVDVGTVCERKISNVFAYTSLYTNQGMMLNTVTFNNKLQLCLVGRLKFLDSQEEIQSILNNIFVYIDKLHHEVDDYNNANLLNHLDQ